MASGMLMHPGRGPGRARFVPPRRTYAPSITPAPAPPGFGAVGAATFVLSLEPGTKVIYSWSTDVYASYTGAEQRTSLQAAPSRRFEGNAFLLDGSLRDLTGKLQRAAVSGATFALALPFEALQITADSPGTVVTVASTAACDWALVGQRCVVVSPSGATATAIVAAATTTTITVALVDATGVATGGSLGTVGRVGGQIMPTIQVLLEPQQGFARYAVNVGLWSVRATANVYGFAGSDSMGVGTSIFTITAEAAVAVTDLADDDVVIWDRVNSLDGTAAEAMQSRTELVDLGGMPFAIGGASEPTWSRSLRLRSSSPDDWQWLKAFLHRMRGRQGVFLLSTNRPDLVFDSTFTAGSLHGIKIKSASVAGAGDYAAWFASPAHKRLAIATTVGVVHATVASVTDNLDGTLSLVLDSDISGTVTKVSFLELVRFDTDDIEVAWNGGTFALDAPVVSVQDAIVAPPREGFLFDTVLLTGALTFPITPPKQLFGAMGQTTLWVFTSDRSLSIAGVHNTATGGNVDGMVMCIANANTTSDGMDLLHEDTNATASDRMRNTGSTTISGARNAVWYRYHGGLQRWLQFWST